MGRREEREERLERVNELIHVIASHGRKFFCYEGITCWLELDERERLWFVDSWRGDRTYTHRNGPWSTFHHGGTLKGLVECFRDFVMFNKQLSRALFEWPEWYCRGDLWGYGANMAPVREAADRLQIVRPPVRGQLEPS